MNMAQRLDGRRAAERVQEELKRRVEELASRGILPKLVMLVSEADEVSLGHAGERLASHVGPGLLPRSAPSERQRVPMHSARRLTASTRTTRWMPYWFNFRFRRGGTRERS